MNEIQMSLASPDLGSTREGTPSWVRQYGSRATPMLAVQFRKKMMHLIIHSACMQVGYEANQRKHREHDATKPQVKISNVVVHETTGIGVTDVTQFGVVE